MCNQRLTVSEVHPHLNEEFRFVFAIKFPVRYWVTFNRIRARTHARFWCLLLVLSGVATRRDRFLAVRFRGLKSATFGRRYATAWHRFSGAMMVAMDFSPWSAPAVNIVASRSDA